MPQGPRRGWVRAVFTGLGVVLCTGLVGCMNGDKDKFPPKIGANTKQAPPGLPGLGRIPGQPGSGGVGVNGQPNYNGLQPAGGFGSVTGRQPNSNTINPATGLGAGGVVPSMNPGPQPISTTGFGGGMPPYTGVGSPGGGNSLAGSPGYSNIPPAPNLADPGIVPPGRPDVAGGIDQPLAPPQPPPMIYRGGN